MTFLELHNKIVQTRKARNGVKNRRDYFDGNRNEDFYRAVYKKALKAANDVLHHYEASGAISTKDKVSVTIG